ncbi:GNAT family N-acetyltransferase [Streptosporangium lutulentum]|uniref:Ribosomal protein S18 acetylase RimI-like enzyme n=1 Tax=Streptosporangium lutulentum TaxID=1461250 RepID=A0ABT9Q7U1_9ACTN|nr:GNAT family N-acetyltransferase [Streptosporangium lutulentum]MDP9842820.1 ribosomal protein S18 acetylase RimI-like enzyme [Streptosporangium lutulentum]
MTDHTDVRQAVEDDVAELVRLRALLFENLGGDFFNPSSAGDDWRDALAAVLREKLIADDAQILVVDGENGLAACGIGTVEQWFPGPHSRNGRIGHVIGVVTDPSCRRRGHSRAIMRGLLGWFRERGAVRVDLYASHEGEPLYRELGFFDHPDPALCWRP